MLHVTYEAVKDLQPGRLARIDEDRGRIRVLLDENEPLAVVIQQLNIEIDKLLANLNWFQLWGDEIISRATPKAPLRIKYLLQREEEDVAVVGEVKGLVLVFIDPGLTTEEFAVAMNRATRKFLASGRWFQLYGGEIVDNGPESMSKV
ncbi:hypothetical protein ABZ915_17410 [Streptomyces sp. NPDC046915]|uniref:hypothetical protein n=1 Tax=Streptomyces sp. NPDC046915 TaxID=3155257 RepID=UPI0033DEEEFD